MADELDFLFGAGSLYNPTKDNRYSDLIGKQEDFNFADLFNKQTASYYDRQLKNQSIQDNEQKLEEGKRSKERRESLTGALAGAQTEEEVADILRSNAIEYGDIGTLDKLDQRKESAKKRVLEEVDIFSKMGLPEAAYQKWVEAYGESPEITPDSFREKGDMKVLGNEIVRINPDGTIKRLYKSAPSGSGKSGASKTWYNREDGTAVAIPAGEPVDQSRWSPVKPSQSIDQQARNKFELEKKIDEMYGYGQPSSSKSAPAAPVDATRYVRRRTQ